MTRSFQTGQRRAIGKMGTEHSLCLGVLFLSKITCLLSLDPPILPFKAFPLMFFYRLRYASFLVLLSLSACFMPKESEEFDSPAAGMARLGNHMREKGEIGAAIDFYRRALANDSKSPMAIKGLAGVLEQWGDKQAAADVYRNGVVSRPDDAEIRRNYGRLLISLEQPAEAKRQFDAALDIDDDDLKAQSGLGVALDYLGEHTKAQKQYEKVLDAEPKNLATLNNLAYSYILSHRYDQAIKLLEPQLNNVAATAAMRQNLALAYGMAGMDVDAERVARMDLSPDKVKANMDYYRRQRAEVAVTTTPYAELGTYATEAMAVGQIERMRGQIEKSGGDLKPVVVPQVATPGGTPRFTVRMMGCSRPDDVSRLCETLAKSNIPCVPRGKGLD
ncbi:MAG: tetratricopeptide repeat protein [Alphaproteobacteria bacterium]|nr:tetratricopeptide repeat protein [Alphaproteobacteria bacterium]